MELHTLGVNGGYTQADVIQVARVLTGWTVDRPQLGGGFQFNPNRHEPGTKKVMGTKIKDHGETGRPRVASLSGHAAGNSAFHFAQAGNPLCERRSSANAGRSHGQNLSVDWRRYSQRDEDAVPLARVLGGKRLPRQGEDAD